ncbi:MAG: peptide chain release factor N(5)-glutamine methyltransferase [Gammaproteobacteria bacterium]
MQTARRTLERAQGANGAASLEAEALLAHVLGTSRAWLYAHSGDEVGPEARERFLELLARRVAGEPLAYLTGEREFWSLRLQVNPAVLIPRPETELLVEATLARLPRDAGPRRVADIGTGSGAIALALASERPSWTIVATDRSRAALAVARANARRLGMERVFPCLGSWCAPLRGPFHAIVSNPPYVRADDPHLLSGDCRHEPELALTPGADEWLAFGEISRQAARLLKPDGWLLFEHGWDQGAGVRDLLEQAGFAELETLRDLQGHERVTLGRLSPPPA